MGSGTGYEPVAAKDIDDEQNSAEEHELEVKLPVAEQGIESSDRLLPPGEEEDDAAWENVTLINSRKKRKSVWLVCFVSLFGLLGAFLLLVGAARLVFHIHKKNTSETFRRPELEYKLEMSWDYSALPQVREYHWTIQEIDANPDGVMKHMLTINGKFPGELIRCNEGDTIVVNVDNQASNATAIHWHGIFQNGTNEMDGVPGITQCPIAPGSKFRYEFTVKGQAGTYFYHGHMAAQAADGLVGPIVVHSRDEKKTQGIPYGSDRVVMIQDWYYDSSDNLLREKLSPGNEAAPVPDSALINGLGKADCSLVENRPCNSTTTRLPSITLQDGRAHRLRLLNVGAYAWFEVSIDKHLSLPIIEVDGTTVTARPEESIIIGPGQRYSIVLTADATLNPPLFWLRARMMKHCFGETATPSQGFQEAHAMVRYATGSTPAAGPDLMPESEKDTSHYAVQCRDMDPQIFHPSPPLEAPEHADFSYPLRVNLAIGAYRLQRGVLNGSSFRPDLTHPSLHRVVSNHTSSFASESQLTLSFPSTVTIDFILQNFDEGNHPFHLHGHQSWVLASGHGYFPGYETLNMRGQGRGLVDEANRTVIENPVRRDVATVEAFGWLLLRVRLDNPGAWFFHCHMLWHGESGMAMQIVARADDLETMGVGKEGRELCEAPREEMLKGATPDDSVWFDTDET
jgi:FtsP/CotA-like multicopper oxidase with cupredoxin domain